MLSNLFYSVAAPTIQKVLITNITDKYIATSSIIICLSSIIVGKMWNEYGNNLYKHYAIFLFSEGLLYGVIVVLMLTGMIPQHVYYIVDALIFAFVTENIIFGCNRLKSIRYEGEERNKYDNTSMIAVNGASLTGFTINLVIGIPETLAFILLVIGMSIDNLFYYRAFKQKNWRYN